MKKFTKFLPIVVILIIVGIGGYLILTRSSLITTSKNGGLSLNVEKKSYDFNNLKTAIALGIPLKCSYKVGNTEAEGFIKGNKWRGKITIQDKVGEVIIKDNCLYSWDETKKGAKMCFKDDIWGGENSQVTPDIDYHCGPAVITDAQFEPPTDIKFFDPDKPNIEDFQQEE